MAVHMENQVRIFREKPFGWFDKSVMRYLREKYGKDKKKFSLIRSVYLALCEIESDFAGTPISFFTKTVGTYAGLSREATGKYINLLIEEGLVRKQQMKDPQTKQFTGGTEVAILSLQDRKTPEKPLSGYPDDGVRQRRDTPTANIKKISISKKINKTVNGEAKNGISGLKRLQNLEQPPEKTAYVAESILAELGDEHSRTFYQLVAAKVPEQVIHTALAEIKADGAQSPPRVFTHRMIAYAVDAEKQRLRAQFSNRKQVFTPAASVPSLASQNSSGDADGGAVAQSTGGGAEASHNANDIPHPTHPRSLRTSSTRDRFRGKNHPPHTPSSLTRSGQSSGDAPSGSASPDKRMSFHGRLSPT